MEVQAKIAPWRLRTRSALLSGGLTMLLVAGIWGILGRYPFGMAASFTSAQARIVVPMHAAMRELLNGAGISDLFFNWNSGLGTPFLSDFATFVASPFNLLLPLTPTPYVEVTLFLIFLLRTGTMATAMTLLLLTLRSRAHPAIAIASGVAYGLSGWVAAESFVNPAWLDGAALLPMHCLMLLWCARNTRVLLATFIAAGTWCCANSSAATVTIGASMFGIAYLLAEASSLQKALHTASRWVWINVIGCAISAFVTVTVFGTGTVKLLRTAEPVTATGSVAEAVRALFAGSYSVAGPVVGISTLILGLAIGLLVLPTVPLRVRVGYASPILITAVTLWWGTSRAFMWTGAHPQEALFRGGYVLTAALTIAAWIAINDGLLPGLAGPRPRWFVFAPLALLAVLISASFCRAFWHSGAPIGIAATFATTTGVGLLLLSLRIRYPQRPRLYAMALALVVVAEASVGFVLSTSAVLSSERTYPALGSRVVSIHNQLAKQRAKDQWPWHRVDQNQTSFSNDPLGAGFAGVHYNSPNMPPEVAKLHLDMGLESVEGEGFDSPPERVRDALYSVNTRLLGYDFEPPFNIMRQSSFQIIRVASPDAPGSDPQLPAPFKTRQDALDQGIYHTPNYDTELPPLIRRDSPLQLRGTCPAGWTLQIAWPESFGSIAAEQPWGTVVKRSRSSLGSNDQAVSTIGAVTDGKFALTVTFDRRDGEINPRMLACVNFASLDAQIAESERNAPTEVSIVGSRLSAHWRKPVEGPVIISTAAQPGWTCHGDGRQLSLGNRGGFMVVDGTGYVELRCGYRPPRSAAASGMSLIAVVLAFLPVVVRREDEADDAGAIKLRAKIALVRQPKPATGTHVIHRSGTE